MKLTCPHKTSDSICANCVVQLIEQAVRVEHAKVEKLREAIMGSTGDYRQGQHDVLSDIKQALTDTEEK